jgi:hypothetical protein
MDRVSDLICRGAESGKLYGSYPTELELALVSTNQLFLLLKARIYLNSIG